MNLKKLLPFLFFIWGIAISTQTQAQSISGKVKTSDTKESLSYATIHIFKGSTRVASLISDEKGNFNIKLDTGVYRCEIQYFGHEKIVREIRVRGDERSDLIMKKLPEAELAAVKVTKSDKTVRGESSRMPADRAMMSISESETVTRGAPVSLAKKSVYPGKPGPGGFDIPSAGAGKLSAGELNDFSKWELWKDLSEGELSQFAGMWQIRNGLRYAVQITGKQGKPLADIPVSLKTKSGAVLWRSRTDNTGKAELWTGFQPDSIPFAVSTLQIAAQLPEGEKILKKPQAFHNGINVLNSETSCDVKSFVDIAFVVDATGSMGDEIEFLKEEMNDVIFKAKGINHQLNMRFANVFYRDHGDEYLTKKQDFTEVLSEARAFVSDQSAGGGGDYEEAVDDALDAAVNQLSWSEHAVARILFLVLDAPPHLNDDVRQKMRSLAAQASAKGIRIVPVVASGLNKSAEYLLRNMALASNGSYVFLTDHSGIGAPHMRPSTDSFQVETLNDIMVRLIRQYTLQETCQEEQQPTPPEPPSSDTNTWVQNPLNTDSSQINPPTNWQIQWKAYPNPTRGLLHIEAMGLQKETEVFISDFNGKVLFRLILNPEQSSATADLSGMASGIYLVRYPSGQEWKSTKIVLIREG